jgi:hypothetical protein
LSGYPVSLIEPGPIRILESQLIKTNVGSSPEGDIFALAVRVLYEVYMTIVDDCGVVHKGWIPQTKIFRVDRTIIVPLCTPTRQPILIDPPREWGGDIIYPEIEVEPSEPDEFTPIEEPEVQLPSSYYPVYKMAWTSDSGYGSGTLCAKQVASVMRAYPHLQSLIAEAKATGKYKSHDASLSGMKSGVVGACEYTVWLYAVTIYYWD